MTQLGLFSDAPSGLTCGHDAVSNFTTSWDTSPHLFCHVCKSHYHKGRVWTRKEWEVDMEAAFRKEPAP